MKYQKSAWISAGVLTAVAMISLLMLPTKAAAQAPPASASREKIAGELKSIVIDHMNFMKTDVATVLEFLSRKSKEADPAKEGVNFVLGDLTQATPANPVHREVSIVLDNVPLVDCLGYITQQTNLKSSIEDGAVYFKP